MDFYLRISLCCLFFTSSYTFAVEFELSQSEPITPVEVVLPVNPLAVALGKVLFHDVRLSKDNSISCASCHDLFDGGDDGLKFSVGINDQVGPINTPTVLNSGLNAFQFWDGRAKTLEEQVEGPVHNTLEMGSNWVEVTQKLKRDKHINTLFSQIYTDGINKKNISLAIAAYERQLVTLDAPFDLYLKGDTEAISVQAKEGYKLFKRMGCISCHQGQNVGGNMFQHFGVMGNYFAEKSHSTTADLGRYNVTGKEEDRYKFKVPSLRNIELTAPYFHDGSADNLEQAIRVMARYQLGRPISNKQIIKIEAFLKSLTGHVDKDLQ